jgi:hypothetical protein
MRYSFVVFAAIYGYAIVENETAGPPLSFAYGCSPSESPPGTHIAIPARYQARTRSEGLPQVIKHRFANEEFCLFFGVDDAGQPDWLGEIFEWLSSNHEMGTPARDSVGRIPFSETVFARQKISPRTPHAAMIMAWLAGSLPNGRSNERLPKPPCPMPQADHLVVCSHDIDFYYTNRASAIFRLLKNLLIAIRLYRSREFFQWNLSKIEKVLRGQRVAAYLPALLEACQAKDVQSTLFVASQRAHRRDPNYALEDLVPELLQSRKKGFSVGVHGSYQSIIEARDLKSEVAAISTALGTQPRGGRQHYLRFDSHEKLFNTIEQAGLWYDSTLGFADDIGFRNGACFPFPPYDFQRERAHEFLEFPLVLMDGNLEAACRQSGEEPAAAALEILQASHKWGWGGVAIDWHNPIEPIQVPSSVNNTFWECLNKRESRKERWIDGDTFLRVCLPRYQSAGLLQGVPPNA